MKKWINYTFLFSSLILFYSCTSNETNEKQEKTPPDFCDCVNHDYHNDGDEEACKKIEQELEKKLETATVEERGEILIQIRDCKVKGQYDND